MSLIRVWKELDSAEIEKSIVIVDDLHGFCPACKNTGIPFSDIKKCTQCGIEFKYITTREKVHSQKGKNIIGKIQKFASDLIFIDYNDYKHASDKDKASNLFSI